jgi:hypothetical protein
MKIIGLVTAMMSATAAPVWADGVVTYNKGVKAAYYGVEATADGGYLASGSYTNGTLADDALLVRYDKDFNVKWKKTYSGNSFDLIADTQVLPNGNIIAVGQSGSKTGDFTDTKGGVDSYIVCLDSTGKQLWKKTLGDKYFDSLYNVTLLADGSLVAVGDIMTLTTQKAWTVRFDAAGGTFTESLFGSGEGTGFDNVIPSKSGGYVAVGWGDAGTAGNTTMDQALLAEFATDGTLVRTKVMTPNVAGYAYEFPDIISVNDGYVIAINSTYYDDNGDEVESKANCGIVKINADLTTVGMNTIKGSNYDEIGGLVATPNNGILVVGSTKSTDQNFVVANKHALSEGFVMQFDGNPITPVLTSVKVYGGKGDDFLFDVAYSGSHYVAVGMTQSQDGDVKGLTNAKAASDGWLVHNYTFAVKSVALSVTKATLAVGKTLQLSATFNPTTASNRGLTWASTNAAVAKVDTTGKVTAVKKGTAVIKVTTTDGKKVATCTVTVK